ncbi:glucose-6-phosphate isomerase [Halanaerobium praevalens]|uniref:Glucose-6-phosphate isomerase n=1 Tax=Halanaerobium praevalens (strain ATCC 33744 / DSM 2228 / GSL) TaxID=572479 RepID=E3DMS9_HALPG|nr:glucose-6-phosphate isomerase [Halanaerobium praevalens]ADO76403.1 glucose-6-phosphate isomerase [Halanaerobium praevalens DSM 2228]
MSADQKVQSETDLRVKLDINNVFAEMIGQKHGLQRKELFDFKDEAVKAHQNILAAAEAGEMGFMELPHNQQEIVAELKQTAEELKDKFDNFVVLGIGGSALGNIAVQTAINDPYYNLFAEARDGYPRLFVSDNVDPEGVKALLAKLDPKKTLFNVISKSGSTAETMSQFLLARKFIAEAVGEDRVGEHFIATTSKDSGYLIEIAEREGMKKFFIPDNVGGRFSVLTPVGLLSAAMTGVDIEQLLAGAAYMDKICRENDFWQNPALVNALIQYLAYKKGKVMSVMMPYSDRLSDLADWYRQLWAESLGKEVDRQGNKVNLGPTPIKALGATDQHSQAQLYMEGPFDKIITFLEVENFAEELEIPKAYADLDGLGYLGDHNFAELINTEKWATELALNKRQRMNQTVKVPKVNEFTLGQLFYFFEFQTAVAGELFNINAFNQPGVELGKNYTYGIFGRSGYQAKKDEFENSAQKNEDLIL